MKTVREATIGKVRLRLVQTGSAFVAVVLEG